MVVKVGGGAEVLTDASSSASDEDVESIIAEESLFDDRRRCSASEVVRLRRIGIESLCVTAILPCVVCSGGWLRAVIV